MKEEGIVGKIAEKTKYYINKINLKNYTGMTLRSSSLLLIDRLLVVSS